MDKNLGKEPEMFVCNWDGPTCYSLVKMYLTALGGSVLAHLSLCQHAEFNYAEYPLAERIICS